MLVALVLMLVTNLANSTPSAKARLALKTAMADPATAAMLSAGPGPGWDARKVAVAARAAAREAFSQTSGGGKHLVSNAGATQGAKEAAVVEGMKAARGMPPEQRGGEKKKKKKGWKMRDLIARGEGSFGVNDADAVGWTALQLASYGGHLALVDMLIEAGADVNQAMEDGATPLFIASQQGHLEVVKALIKAKAKVNQAMEGGATPLWIASQQGKLEVVKELIKAKAKVNQAKDTGSTPLWIASQNGKLEVVKELIKAKAKVNQAREDGETPLFAASYYYGYLEVVTELIEAKAAVNQARKNGCTPIYMASQQGHTPIVQVLIDAGARTAELMFNGSSMNIAALHIAAGNGHLECVKLLTGFRPNTAAWITFLAGATSKKELEAYNSPPANRPPTYLPKIFDRAYVELIWKFQQERYSDLHLETCDEDSKTALEIAEIVDVVEDEDDEDEVKNALAMNAKRADVAKLLRSMMVLPKCEKKKEEPKGPTEPTEEGRSINCDRCGAHCGGKPVFPMTHVEPCELWCNTCHGAHHGLEDDDEEGGEFDEEETEGKE